MEKRGKKYSSGGRGKAATKQQQRNRSQAVSADSALLAEPCGGPADQQAKQRRDHGTAAQNAAEILPAVNSLRQHGQDSPRLALCLKRGNGDHRGKKDGVAGVPAQKEQDFIALRVHAIDAADAKDVGGHHRQRDPLGADKIDADKKHGTHGNQCAAEYRLSEVPSTTAISPRDETE